MSKPRWRRRLLAVGAILIVFLALYTALGYLAAPALVRDALVERAAAAGYELRFGAISTQPFRLIADGYEVQLSTSAGRRLLSARRASIDLAWSSLWRDGWALDRVALEAPVLHALPLPSPAGQHSAARPTPVAVRELQISDGRLALDGAPVLEALEVRARDLATGETAQNSFDASAKLARGGTLRTQGRLSLMPLHVSGELQLADAALAEVWRYLPRSAGEAPHGSLSGRLRYRYADGKLALSQASAQARLASGGRLAAAGELAFSPFGADLRLHADALPLAFAQPFVGAHTKLVLAGGTLSGEGRLRLGREARYDGSVAITQARIDGPAGELAGWQSLATEELHLELSPFAARAEELRASRPRLRVAIGPQGELNLAQALAGEDKNAAESTTPRIAIARLVVQEGELDFTDRSLDTPFATTVQALSGALTQASTTGDEAARVELSGRVGRYGEANLRGTIDLTAPASRTNLQMRFRNLALPGFTPYAAKFAGYRIDAGRLDASLSYRVRDGRMVGSNELVFERLKLGEKVRSDTAALDLPLDLAVALLTDAEGRIDLAIPVRGDLRDPEVDLGGLIAQALRNTLGQIVSAPFRLIGSLLGRPGAGKALDEVRFAPGSAQLPPPEQETAAALARALAERPRLALAVHGGYDAEADRQALARAQLLRELARRVGYESAAAGSSAPAGIDPRDPRIVYAAERLFLERGGSSAELAPLQPRSRGYGRRLLDFLATRAPVDAHAAQALARRRAEAVREALVAGGVDSQRIIVEQPQQTQAAAQGVPSRLALKVR